MKLIGLDYLGISDFFSDEELLVQKSCREFVDSEVLPIIDKHFKDGTFPKDLIKKFGELGYLGMNLPEKYGCAGLSNIAYGLLCQELERGDSGIRSFVSVQGSLVMYPIYAYGSEQQREKWLPKLASGELIGCFGLTEPNFGSNPSGMLTNAVKTDGGYLLNGSKMWITNGSIADISVVWAKDEDGKIKGFIVDNKSEGFSAPMQKGKWSLRASITSELVFENVFVPDSHLLPNVKGLKGPLSCLTQARYGISWGVIGAAESCLEELLNYTESRILFDRSLDENQAIQIRLADMQRRIVTSSLLSYRLGQLKDLDQMNPTQVSLAKWNNVRMALDVARDCRDMLGGSGISAEYVPIRHMLNLESVVTYEGTETIHQLAVGRSLTGKNAF